MPTACHFVQTFRYETRVEAQNSPPRTSVIYYLSSSKSVQVTGAAAGMTPEKHILHNTLTGIAHRTVKRCGQHLGVFYELRRDTGIQLTHVNDLTNLCQVLKLPTGSTRAAYHFRLKYPRSLVKSARNSETFFRFQSSAVG